MKWKRISKYAISSGEWIIAKFIIDGVARYGLSFAGKNLGYFDDAEQAKRQAVTPGVKEAA